MKDESQFLLLPGPTPVPTNILRAMSTPMINHRGAEFKELLEYCTEGVKRIYRTKNDLVIFPSAGSGAMEAAVVNFISPGDKVLAISIGVFGDRFAKIAGTFGAQVTKLDFPFGEAADPAKVKEAIDADTKKEYKAVLVTHNETSTGVLNDIKAIRQAVGDHPALIIVDAVSGLGAADLRTDEWNLDVVVSGSQKAFMLPPGLSFMSASPRAIKVAETCTNTKFYWDLGEALKYLKKGQTPYTPAISMFYGLREALEMMLDEGLDNVLARHAFYRDIVRTGVKAMGLEFLAKDEVASYSLTSVKAQGGSGANKIRKSLLERFNVVIAGGQQSLDDVIFRIGHLGYVRPLDLLSVLAALEIVLYENGYNIKLGQGIKKAQELFVKKEEA
ncbi:MAG: pyridoxal-phosphate-dependent aminotransferase family protein [Candidatus Saccharibacteria bacterium]